MRKLVVVLGLVEAVLAVSIACSSFHGQSTDSPDGGSDADGSMSNADGANTGDANASDAGTLSCNAFDAAGISQPTTNLDSYPCPSGNANLNGDGLNCGWCGHVCLDSKNCTMGVCDPYPVVADPTVYPAINSVTDAGIYWWDMAGAPNTVYRSPATQAFLDASTLLTEVPDAEPPSGTIYSMAVDDRIYIRAYDTIFTVPLTGGTPSSLVQPMGEATSTMVTSGTHLLETQLRDGFLYDFDKAKGTQIARKAALDDAYDLTVMPNGKYAFVVARTAVDGGLINDGAAYQTYGILYRYNLLSGVLTSITQIDTPASNFSVLAADDEYVYYPDAKGSIYRLPVDATNGSSAAIVMRGEGQPVWSMAVNADHIFWFAYDPAEGYSTLMGANKCGGGAFTYSGPGTISHPYGPVVNGPYLYWSYDNGISRVAW